MANCLFCASSAPQDPPITDQNSTFFILENILKIPFPFLVKLAGLSDGKFRPEHWVNMCSACLSQVTNYTEIRKTMYSLQAELQKIETTLKGRMEFSKDSKVGGPIWLGIRSKVLGDETLASFMYENEGTALEGMINVMDEEQNDGEEEQVEEEETDGEEMELVIDEHDETPSSTFPPCFPSSLGNPLPQTPSVHIVDLVNSNDEMEQVEKDSHPNPPANNPVPQPRPVQPIVRKRMNNSKPHYISYFFGSKRFFECRHCAYYGQNIGRMKKHLSLHDEGSTAIQCEACFWLVSPQTLHLHYRNHHHELPIPEMGPDGLYTTVRNGDFEFQQVVNLIAAQLGASKSHFQCSECVASFTCLEACQMHAKRHIQPVYDWCKL
ncbi:unnamed protein product [Orchesella dallaii]|uniref:C2H2-type domain-containing protein n=1 Tax=Orchesella dallaii TaxID=48710 RepID=A0ABP1PXT7_9HEXA